ncbi:MAG: acyltransferase [Acidimicrobiia bacterium]|nr:acyltransferase [Acidimicrobiia bacterium]
MSEHSEVRSGATWEGLAPLEGHRVDVQVLRGIAVLIVVLFHADIVAPGGFVGVDVFFVISGFVIGRILVRSLSSEGRVSFRTFYARRARRLLPALAVLLGATVVLSPLLAPIGADGVTSATAVAAALFSANLYLYASPDGYFDAAAELNPLLHTWSLSVEEQFYFVVPALLAVAWRLGRRWGTSLGMLRLVTASIGVVSFAACLVTTYVSSLGPLPVPLRFAFFSPVTRAWEFAAGVALVLIPATWLAPLAVRRVGVVLGLALIGGASLGFSDATLFPGAAALIPVLGAVLVLYGGTSASPGPATTPRGLEPLVWLGDISYSWYLWHWPLIVFARAYWPDSGATPLVIAAIVALGPAVASYRLLERPLRGAAAPRPGRAVALAGVCIAVPLVLVAAALPVYRMLDTNTDVQTIHDSQQVAVARTAEHPCHDDAPLGARPADSCRWGPEDATNTVVLIGDSNANHFGETLIGAIEGRDTNLVVASASLCPFLDPAVVADGGRELGGGGGQCARFITESLTELVADPPDVVFIGNRTDDYIASGGRRLIVDPETGEVLRTVEERMAAVTSALADVVATLEAAGIDVVVINVVPRPTWTDPLDCSRLLVLVDPGRCAFDALGSVDDSPLLDLAHQVETEAAAVGGGTTLDLTDALCPGGQCPARIDGDLQWRDETHLSVAAAGRLAEVVDEELDRLDQPGGDADGDDTGNDRHDR